MVNTVTTNLARGSQERHLSTHSASHLERQQPAGLIYPSLERRNYPELSCIGGLHPAGIPECMPQFNGSPKSHWILGVTLQTLAGSRPERRNCLQFRPVPVLAESESDRPTNRRLGKLKARESTPAPKVNDRTLAAGRIQFMSAWRRSNALGKGIGRHDYA